MLETEVGKLADRVAKVPGIADLETSVKPGLPAYAVRLQARRGARARHDADASWRPACAPSSTATSRPTGRRPTASRSRWSCGCRAASRENIAQLDDLPVAYAKDGTPIALGRVADIVPVVNPEIIKRQDLQRRQAIYAGVKGRPAGDVGAEVQKIVKARQLPPGYRFDVGGQTKDQEEAFAARPGGAGARRDLHLHRAGLAVRELPAADGDHGLAAAGADRRDAGAAGHAARR